MLRKLCLFLFALCSLLGISATAFAQCSSGYAQVTATQIGANAPLATGTLTVTAIDASLNPINFSVAGGGIWLQSAIKRQVVNGAILGTLCLPRSDQSSTIVGYHFIARDTSPTGGNAVVLDVNNVAITTSPFSLDTYQYAPVNPWTLNVPSVWQGVYSAGTTYATGAIVVEGGSTYVSLVASNRGNDPAGSPSSWQPLGGAGSGTWSGGTISAASAFRSTVSFGSSAQASADATGYFAVPGETVGCYAFNRYCSGTLGGTLPDTTKGFFQVNHNESSTPALDTLTFSAGNNTSGSFQDYRVEYGTGHTRYIPSGYGGTPPADNGYLWSVGGSTVAGFDGSGNLTLPEDPADDLQAATKHYVDNHAGTANLAAPGPIGSTTPGTGSFTNVTAQSVSTNGSAPSGFTVTPNGTIPTAPTNSITYSAPASVPTPYVFLPPTNVTDATTQTPLQCTYAPGPPATLTCALVAISGGSGVGNGISSGINSTNYSALSWNGNYANGTYLGFLADTTGSNPALYANVPTGGRYNFEIAGAGAFIVQAGTAPTGACTGTYFYLSTGDQKVTTCNGSTYSTLSGGSGGLSNGISTGVNSGNYSCLTFNGTCANGSYLGLVADTSGTDPNQYYNVPTGGKYIFEVGGTGFVQATAAGVLQPLTTPSSSSATCVAGTVQWDTGFLYVCTATNTWKRTALSTF